MSPISTGSPGDFRSVFPYTDAGCGVPDRQSVVMRYVTGELSAEEVDAFDEHCFYCRACFLALQEKEDLKAALDNMAGENAAPPPVEKTGMTAKNFFYRIAAALLLLAVSISGLLLILRDPGQQLPQGEFNAPYPAFENLLESTRAGEKLRVFQPQDNDILTANEVLFQWEWAKLPATREGYLSLTVFDNSGREVLTHNPQNSQQPLGESLTPGLYYWQLRWVAPQVIDNELLHVGRFYIR